MSINLQLNKQNVVFQTMEHFWQLKKEWSTNACYNIDKPWKYNVKWKKPFLKEHILYKWNCILCVNLFSFTQQYLWGSLRSLHIIVVGSFSLLNMVLWYSIMNLSQFIHLIAGDLSYFHFWLLYTCSYILVIITESSVE